MLTSFLNIQKLFFPLWRRVFSVRFVVNKFLAFITITALLISKYLLSLQSVQNSFLNNRKSVTANFNLPPKPLNFSGFFYIVVCNRLNRC